VFSSEIKGFEVKTPQRCNKIFGSSLVHTGLITTFHLP